jgi:hypothetical protein
MVGRSLTSVALGFVRKSYNCFGNVAILLATAPRNANGPDHFSGFDDRNATVYRNGACHHSLIILYIEIQI